MPNDLAFKFFLLFQPVIWFLIVKKKSNFVINIFNVTLIFMFFFQYLGLGLFILNWVPRDKIYLENKETLLHIFIISSLVINLFILGYFSGKKIGIKRIIKSNHKYRINTNFEKYYTFLLYGMSIFFLYQYINF